MNNLANLKKGNGETILLLENQSMLLDMFKNILESLNYKVTAASDSRMAVEMFRSRQETISLLILEMSMCKLGASDVLKEIRELDPKVKTIYLTSQVTQDVTGSGNGNSEIVLLKPILITDLSQAIHRLLHS